MGAGVCSIIRYSFSFFIFKYWPQFFTGVTNKRFCSSPRPRANSVALLSLSHHSISPGTAEWAGKNTSYAPDERRVYEMMVDWAKITPLNPDNSTDPWPGSKYLKQMETGTNGGSGSNGGAGNGSGSSGNSGSGGSSGSGGNGTSGAGVLSMSVKALSAATLISLASLLVA